jgi:hypothetical protein
MLGNLRRDGLLSTLVAVTVVGVVCWAASCGAAEPIVLFADDFETGLAGWTTSGTPDWHEGAPSSGIGCVHLEKNESISRTVDTTGCQDITFAFALGAENLVRADENIEAQWHDGVDWTPLVRIEDGDPEEDGQLHWYEFALPAEAADRADFGVRFKMTGRAGGESGYVDDVVVLGSVGDVTLSVAGEGGSLLADGAPQSLPWSGTYPVDSIVILEAVPDECRTFAGWNGDIVSDENPLEVVLDGNTSLVATFIVVEYSLAVGLEGNGVVEVDGVPYADGYVDSHECGSVIILEAIVDDGWQFVGWVGDLESAENPLSLLMDSELNLTAVFLRLQYSLSLMGEGGMVSVDGVAHALPWSDLFDSGTAVVLEATPDDCMRFDGWSGDLAGIENPVTVVVDADTSAAAHFVSMTIFSDVDCDHWAASYVAACYYAGIVSGYPDGTYGPGIPISRDQMAVYMCRALVGGDSHVPDGPPEASFPDVPYDHWAFRHVEYAVDLQVVQGYPDGEYKPSVELDRGQMAVFIARAMTGSDEYVPDPSGPASFPDVAADFWAYRHVEYIAGQGVAAGYGDGLYHPEMLCTRDQMAVYIARAFDLRR